ncbi:MAG TPA: tetratricopeptide repeat protein [Bryobacteraceae bacterium]|nr:tetratricopeptide repeat protein [Bryobacteraceae bacterium]
MNPGAWPELETIYLEAQALAPADRPAFLDRACAGNAALRAEVESLLAADEAYGDFLEKPLSRLAAGLIGKPELPRLIGRYRIAGVLGEGGMGTVYQAEQQTPHRTVALKVIRPGMAFDGLVRRFELESEALGRLQHPGIAQVYDAGTFESASGAQPYFAMEYVKGRPLLAYASEQSLDSRGRLELMAKICDAVDHAHQHGILHRDLKPGNILVTASGQPKVLDFGVARIMDSDVQATRQTDIGQLIGTLEYMSPEQTFGDPQLMDARSDIYSLGVVLYQLLAGKLPYGSGQHSLPDIVQAIREYDPEPLSIVDRRYRGDVDVIAAKALEKDRERRYRSAAEMAADIRRHLASEPIVARRASAAYRTAKFVRRYRTLVAVVCGAGLLILAFGITMTILAVRYARERDAAELTSDFLQGLFMAANPLHAQGRLLTARDLLDMGAARLAKNLTTQPSVRADLAESIGQAYQQLGALDGAEAMYDIVVQERPKTPDDRKEVPRSYRIRGDIRRLRGKLREAEQDLRTAAALWEKHPADDPREGADIYNNLGLVLDAEGNPREACAFVEKAVTVAEKFPAKLANTLVIKANLGLILAELAQFGRAEGILREVMAERTRVYGENHPNVPRFRVKLGRVLAWAGSLAEAEKMSLEGLEGVRRLTGPEHVDVFATLNDLGLIYQGMGRTEEAEARLREAWELARRVLGPAHPETVFYEANLGSLLLERGSVGQAEPLLDEAYAYCRAFTQPSRRAPVVLAAYGRLLVAEHKLPEAEPILHEALALRETALGRSHPATAAVLMDIAALRLSEKRCGDAVPLSREALATVRRFLPEGHPETVKARAGLGRALRACGLSEETR